MYVIHVINHANMLVKVCEVKKLSQALAFKKAHKSDYEKIFINRKKEVKNYV